MDTNPRPELSVQHGFSLIEIMIVVTVLAIISILSWRGIDSLLRTQEHLQARASQSAHILRTLQQIERDVAWRTTVELPVRNRQDSQRGVQGNTAGTEPTPDHPAASTDRNAAGPVLPPGIYVQGPGAGAFSLDIVRAAPTQPGYWQRVRWSLRAGTLYRSAGTSQAYFPFPAPAQEGAVASLDKVHSIRVRAWVPGMAWVNLPHNGLVPGPATGLEVVMRLQRPENGEFYSYRQVLPLN